MWAPSSHERYRQLPSTIVVPMNQPSLLELSRHVESNGKVVVFEEGTVPFEVKRCFVVIAGKGQVRGEHAHRKCTQLLIAINGQIRVTVDDGRRTREFLLSDCTHGLLIPRMTWATQHYLSDESQLLAVCDTLYSEDDYIRSYETFKRLISV